MAEKYTFIEWPNGQLSWRYPDGFCAFGRWSNGTWHHPDSIISSFNEWLDIVDLSEEEKLHLKLQYG